jgi:hypothetical protein
MPSAPTVIEGAPADSVVSVVTVALVHAAPLQWATFSTG